MSDHTPGPWRVEKEVDGMPHGRLTRVFDANGKQIASTFNQTRAHLQYPFEVAEVNARLIAAAPDLLAVLKELIADADPEGHGSVCVEETCTFRSAHLAIAKAEGREP